MFSAGVSGCISALTMVRWRASKLMAKLFSYRAGQDALREETIRLQGLVMDFAKSGNAVVPFQQGGGVANSLHRAVVQFPDGIDYRMIVSIENIFFVFGMAGDMNLRD